MRVSQCVGCKAFSCRDVEHHAYMVPDIDVIPEAVSIMLIAEAAPSNPRDYFYARGDSSFARTTVLAFNDAGAQVSSMRDILDLGVYLTTALKCGKTAYGVETDTIKACSALLQREMALFPKVKAYLLMGDVAIKSLNYISIRSGTGRVIPAGSTYKLRGPDYRFRGSQVFPSYLQVGPSFDIEKSKRRMIAEDIGSALRLLQ